MFFAASGDSPHESNQSHSIMAPVLFFYSTESLCKKVRFLLDCADRQTYRLHMPTAGIPKRRLSVSIDRHSVTIQVISYLIYIKINVLI